MKIKLTNFRCYESAEFDFGQDGIALLSGQSGSGKSSILMGIHFALTGEGKKIVQSGKTSCCVELEIGNLKIKRTTRPNRLVLNDVYEDAAAQEIINNAFGKSFECVGYISQNARDSFINMSPTAKLEFLETFVLDGLNVNDLKLRAGVAKKNANLQLNTTVSKLEMAKHIMNTVTKPDEIPFPLPFKKQVNQEKAIRNEETKLKNISILEKRVTQKLQQNQERHTDIVVKTERKRRREQELELATSESTSVFDALSNLQFFEEELEQLREELREAMTQQEYMTLKKNESDVTDRLNQLSKDEERSTQKKKDECLKIIQESKYTTEELTGNINVCIENLNFIREKKERESQLKSLLNHYTSIGQLAQKLEDQKLELKLKQAQLESTKVLRCPCCQSSLKLNDERVLVSFTSDIETSAENLDKNKLVIDIQVLSNEIKRLESLLIRAKVAVENLADYDEIDETEESTHKSDLKEFNALLEVRKTAECELLKLEKENKSVAIQSLEKELLSIKSTLKSKFANYTYSQLPRWVDAIKDDIRKQETRKETDERLRKQQQELIKRRFDLLEEIKRLGEDIDEQTKTYTENATNLACEKDRLISEKETVTRNLSEIEKWKANQVEVEKWKKVQAEIDALSVEQGDNEKALSAATVLYSKILEAESIAIEQIIEQINTHAQLFLDCFFPEHPISARLRTFKESKTTGFKPQINLEIDYKGMECDLNMLSGGEYSRLNLAFTLALAEMSNVPLVLLDECTSSLDQESTTIVLEGLKSNFANKLVVLIAHQVVHGMFDNIVKL